MKLIPNKLTVMKAVDVLKAFRAAFEKIMGSAPSNSTLAILTAQSALECARWVSMHCFNFGNIRPPKGWTGAYCQFRCNEKIKGVWVWYDPPSPGSNFVAFETAEDGAEFYMRKLAQQWPEAWNAALHGDTAGFVHGLKVKGYFTADETPYRVAVQKLCTEFFDYINRNLVIEASDADVAPHEPDMSQLHDVIASPVVIAPALLIGAEGPAVGKWQEAIGLTGDDVDDDFGPKTEAATRAWQHTHKLPETGVVTMADLVAAGLAPAPGASA